MKVNAGKSRLVKVAQKDEERRGKVEKILHPRARHSTDAFVVILSASYASCLFRLNCGGDMQSFNICFHRNTHAKRNNGTKNWPICPAPDNFPCFRRPSLPMYPIKIHNKLQSSAIVQIRS